METQGKRFIASKLQFDTNFNLFGLTDQRELHYLLNGDIEGNENNNNSLLIQNALSNELCVSLPKDFNLLNGIQLDNFEYVIFLSKPAGLLYDSIIALVNTQNCTYTELIRDNCLNLHKPIRGVYKRLNKTNERVIYFVDGVNPNRYLNVDQSLLGNYPKILNNADCNTCNAEETDSLDCNQLRINKVFQPPCLNVVSNRQGSFATGTYQIGLAYSEDGIILTDFYLSNPLKVQSNRVDIGFQVNIECLYSPFSSFRVVLISQTKEGSLIVYDFGDYSSDSTLIMLNTDSYATVGNISEVLSKKSIYDKSQHIASNEETLLLGKHQSVEPLEYQQEANQIEVEWVAKKVPQNQTHLYPTLMRDEVYDLSLEWIDELGQVRGTYHIPGRAKDNTWAVTDGISVWHEDDPPFPQYYSTETLETCPDLPTEIWQIENTATISETISIDCTDCGDEPAIFMRGKMGYYECRDITYPDEDRWGDLRCQKVRRHKMPPNEVVHIHNSGICVEREEILTVFGIDIPYLVKDYQPDPCVNILGIRLNNITIPSINGVSVEGWSYRLLMSDRTGNKSVLHKGLIHNMMKETIEGEEIMYPNYPYNDLNADRFLSKTQSNDNTDSDSNVDLADLYYKTKFTYLSPDTQFKEIQGEFGTEMRIYTEERGKIKGEFVPMYRHPKVVIAADVPDVKTSWSYVQQMNSAAHYEDWRIFPYIFEKRRKIDYNQWLLPIKQFADGEKINNDMRETSYYVKLNENKEVPNPTYKERSRFTKSDIGCGSKFQFCDNGEFGLLGEEPLQVSSYYVGIKVPQPNQYGQNSQIKYKPVDSCYRKVPTGARVVSSDDFFGGDVYISRHSFLRKMPLFSEWLYDVPYNTEYDYRDKRNVWYPIYWFDNLTVSADLAKLDCWVADDIEEDGDSGYIYSWITGNSYFWCESEFIGDYRETDITPNSRFYPKVDYNEIAKSDNIRLQQTFLYDFSLLNNSVETKYLSGYTKSDANFTVIFSLKNDLQSAGDNWLKFLPLNYTILPQVYGDFTGLHYVDQYSVFFIFENMILYSQEDYTIQTSQGNTIFLGQGDIFSRRLKKISNDKTGYTGSVDPLSFINTRYGTFFFDRRRKKIFQWTGQLKELKDINSWLQKYSDGNNINYENSMIAVFDNFTDNLYFTDRVNQWTVSFKPKQDGFISFHSFIPEWYFSLPNNFISSHPTINGLWKHNKIGSYQRYYGIKYPFDVGFVENLHTDVDLASMTIDVEFYKHLDYHNKVFIKDRFFDRIFVYNHQGSTGILEAILKNKNNPKDSLLQARDNFNIAEVSHIKGSSYNINQLENNHAGQTFPIISFENNGYEYQPLNIILKDVREREEIKGKYFVIHLISDNKEDEKIILNLSKDNIIPQFL
jgi:hypothetical protein